MLVSIGRRPPFSWQCQHQSLLAVRPSGQRIMTAPRLTASLRFDTQLSFAPVAKVIGKERNHVYQESGKAEPPSIKASTSSASFL